MATVYILISVLCLLFAHAIAVITAAIATARRARCDAPCDVLIILGSRVDGDEPCPDLLSRISKAADYLTARPNCLAVATGGCFREGQKLSEAQVIKDGLAAAGVDPRRVLIEDRARTTYENFTNCKNIISQNIGGKPVIGILSNTYHLFRAGLIARDSGLDGFVLISASSPKPAAGYLRESIVIFEVWGKRIKRALRSENKK